MNKRSSDKKEGEREKEEKMEYRGASERSLSGGTGGGRREVEWEKEDERQEKDQGEEEVEDTHRLL